MVIGIWSPGHAAPAAERKIGVEALESVTPGFKIFPRLLG